VKRSHHGETMNFKKRCRNEIEPNLCVSLLARFNKQWQASDNDRNYRHNCTYIRTCWDVGREPPPNIEHLKKNDAELDISCILHGFFCVFIFFSPPPPFTCTQTQNIHTKKTCAPLAYNQLFNIHVIYLDFNVSACIYSYVMIYVYLWNSHYIEHN